VALRSAEASAIPLRLRRREQRAVRTLVWAIERELAERPALGVGELALDGRALMVITGAGAGGWVGEALRELLAHVLADPSLNTPDALTAIARRWWERRRAPPLG
jgi:hypothetical protein